MIRSVALAAATSLLLCACGSDTKVPDEPADAPTAAEGEFELAPSEPATPSDDAPQGDASSPATPTPPRTAGRGGGRMGPMTLAQMQARSTAGFARIDADSDGVISTAELQAAEDAGQRGARRFARADDDNDGRVTRAEATAMVSRMFVRMDADGDGTVTPDERPQGRRGVGED